MKYTIDQLLSLDYAFSDVRANADKISKLKKLYGKNVLVNEKVNSYWIPYDKNIIWENYICPNAKELISNLDREIQIIYSNWNNELNMAQLSYLNYQNLYNIKYHYPNIVKIPIDLNLNIIENKGLSKTAPTLNNNIKQKLITLLKSELDNLFLSASNEVIEKLYLKSDCEELIDYFNSLKMFC